MGRVTVHVADSVLSCKMPNLNHVFLDNPISAECCVSGVSPNA
jgi:hypothetical protein